MPDIFTAKQRSQIMRQVKSSRNKSTELRLIKFFRKNSITGWRRNYKLFGKPDFVFEKSKHAIFVDGCFWHGHSCRNTKPEVNKDYWQSKILRNRKRDLTVNKTLKLNDWKVIRIWECQLGNENLIRRKLKRNGICPFQK